MKKILLLLVAMLATTTVWAEDYITDVMVIGGNKTETDNLKASYTAQGWTVIDQDLNAGCGSGSDYIYLLYKKASEFDENASFITYFFLTTNDMYPDSIQQDTSTYYYLVDYDGGAHFKELKGDLNSNASGAHIHLYYIKENYSERYNIAKNIYFNNIPDGAVLDNEYSLPCDLNKGAGSSSDYIYMHVDMSQGWIIQKNVTGDQCYIKSFDGPKTHFSSIIMPYSIDGAIVTGATSDVFAGFSNLETLTFFNGAQIEEMPVIQGCSKLKHVNTTSNYDQTPPSMTKIPGYAFAGTAINEITLDAVTRVENSAFEGCNNLSSVIFNTSPVLIENYAFSNISSYCQISYPGSIEDWGPTMYMFSPNLIVKNGTSWSCGWCGGADEASHNMLYWTLADDHLKISSYGDWWESYPDKQIIATKRFEKSMKTITLEHVYSIGQREFENLNELENVYIEHTLHSIGKEAFYGCNDLKDIWFDGNQAQWDAVTKDSQWKNGTSNLTEHWHCMVIFNNNGHGSTPDPKTIQWSNLDKVDEPEPLVADGYNFKGWFTDAACTNLWNFNNAVPGDMTLYAGWEEIIVNVPGDVNGDGSVTSADVTELYNHLLNGDMTYVATGDVNGDGTITSADITAVYSILLGN